MSVGEVYEFKSGKYSCMYMVQYSSFMMQSMQSFIFKRVKSAKTKADANRFPDIISISMFAKTIHQINHSYE
jgi:hypothetical protein